MSYLVDANVLSEPTRAEPSALVTQWLRQHEREIAVDPIIIGEIRFGILPLPRGKPRSRLERWFDEGVGRLKCLAWKQTLVFAGRSSWLTCAKRVAPFPSTTA